MSSKINERQLRAVQLLAAGRTGRQVAEELGVTPETVSRWRSEPGFCAELNALLNDAVHTSRQRLRNLVADAVDVVEQVLRDPAAPPKLRIEAACRVLDRCGFKEVGVGGGEEDPAKIERDRLERQDILHTLHCFGEILPTHGDGR